MNIVKLNCAACGAPISIPEDVQQITCTSCGSSLLVDRGQGYVALKVAEKLAKAIENSGTQTQEVIRENTQVTRTELQRLQLSQEIATAEMQLNGIQSEIRTLERESKNPTAVRQLIDLHENEYAVMERLHTLKLQIAEPSPDDLNGRIALAEWEIAWVGMEMNALKDSNHHQKRGLLASLTERQNRLGQEITELKSCQLRKQYASFQLQDPPIEDAAKLSSLLGVLTADEHELQKHTKTVEGRSVHAEIMDRIKKVQEALHRLDLEKITGTLTSFKDSPDVDDPVSIQDHLLRIDQDLQHLLNMDQTEAVREIQQEAIRERKRTLQQLQALERGSQPLNISQTDKSALKMSQQSSFGQVGLGCLLWVLILIGFFVVGFLIFGLSKPAGTPTNLDMLPIFFFVLVGFALGSRVFLQRAAPMINIRGFAGLRDLVITSKHPQSAVKNPHVIRILVGLITCTNVILLFITLALLIPEGISWLSAMLFVIGFMLGPIAAWFIGKRTTVSVAG